MLQTLFFVSNTLFHHIYELKTKVKIGIEIFIVNFPCKALLIISTLFI